MVQDNHSLLLCLLKMLSQLLVQCALPPHVGGVAAASPHRKSTTGLKKREAKPALAQLQNTLTHCIPPLRLTLKKKIQNSKREADEEPILGQDYQDSKSDLTPN